MFKIFKCTKLFQLYIKLANVKLTKLEAPCKNSRPQKQVEKPIAENIFLKNILP